MAAHKLRNDAHVYILITGDQSGAGGLSSSARAPEVGGESSPIPDKGAPESGAPHDGGALGGLPRVHQKEPPPRRSFHQTPTEANLARTIPPKLGAADRSECGVEWEGGTTKHGSLLLSGKPTRRRRSQLIMACILMPGRVASHYSSFESFMAPKTYCKHAILLQMEEEKVLFFPPGFDLLSSILLLVVG